jgi:D-sedoheptulose 7-phosphate isomerase
VSLSTGTHLSDLLARSQAGLQALEAELSRLERWGTHLYARLAAGGRLLAAGNGGSAALAEHLSAELVGRFDRERPAFSALALCTQPAGVTAIANDYGYEEVFARQVAAHGRPGDVLVTLSTSGRSPNLVRAVAEGRRLGLVTWAMTGPAPNPLAQEAGDALAVPYRETSCIQDVQQVAVHLLCLSFELAGERP